MTPQSRELRSVFISLFLLLGLYSQLAKAEQGDLYGHFLGKLVSIKKGLVTKTCHYMIECTQAAQLSFLEPEPIRPRMVRKRYSGSSENIWVQDFSKFASCPNEVFKSTVFKGQDCPEEFKYIYNELTGEYREM